MKRSRKLTTALIVVIAGLLSSSVAATIAWCVREAPLPATPAMLWTMAIHGSPELVNSQLMRGVDPNVHLDRGKTPLHEAARLGRLEICRILLDAGADVDARDERDMTPLMECGLWLDNSGRHLEIARMLMARGANPKATAFDVGARSVSGFLGKFTVRDILERYGDGEQVQEFRELIGAPRRRRSPAKSDFG